MSPYHRAGSSLTLTHSHTQAEWSTYLSTYRPDDTENAGCVCGGCHWYLHPARLPHASTIVPSNSKANGCFSFSQARKRTPPPPLPHTPNKVIIKSRFSCTYQNWQISSPHFALHAFTHDTINVIRSERARLGIDDSAVSTRNCKMTYT